MSTSRKFFVLNGFLCLATLGCDAPAAPPGPPPVAQCRINLAPMAVAIGARANSPVPVLPDAVRKMIRHVAWAKHKVTVLGVDGVPAESFSGTFPAASKNPDRLKLEFEEFIKTLEAKAQGVRAKEADADVLTALTLGGRIVGEGGTVVLVDSGLQTLAPLDFADILMAEPAEVAEALEREKKLPDLRDRTVVLAYLGDTAPPQKPLYKSLQDNVIAIWSEIAKRSGACVEVIRREVGQPKAVTDVPPVATIEVPGQETPRLCGHNVFYNSGPVGFVADSDRFADEAAARERIRLYADALKGSLTKVTLIGTTAYRTTDSGRDLSLRRAKAVKRLLVELGVDGERIETIGMASDYPHREIDIDAKGNRLPGPAARNRSVVLEAKC